MKKYLIALVALLIITTGCGNTKKLTCTATEDGMQTVTTMEFDKEDALTKMTVTEYVEFEEELTDEELEMYKSLTSIACSSFTSESTTCEVNVTSKKMEVVVTYDIPKMTDEEFEETGYTKEEATYETMKKDAEDSGYTCK